MRIHLGNHPAQEERSRFLFLVLTSPDDVVDLRVMFARIQKRIGFLAMPFQGYLGKLEGIEDEQTCRLNMYPINTPDQECETYWELVSAIAYQVMKVTGPVTVFVATDDQFSERILRRLNEWNSVRQRICEELGIDPYDAQRELRAELALLVG